MQQARIQIQNEVGLHARPAAQFVKCAKQFSSKITVTYGGKTVDAKSLIRVLSLSISRDGEIEITVEGSDEKESIASLLELIQGNFSL
ncbi:HPr family phosphocarrier protein [Dictyobacter arantiisoli]|uniref:Phosphocarrier protein HPr n=1 Tax=Dictyobacter arantiisoli TaxID=2014874 RepID=A0A5A5TBY2_9CHLR|nr:HPr family phosphocarrier protein [Dictyobacter arantiisoli]GCF08888.1 hypothetical protein KDI_24520 [Dictyobacter arantiisoli]